MVPLLRAHHVRHHGACQHERRGGVHRDEAVPLRRRNVPEAQRIAPLIGADRALPDAGIIDQDVDATGGAEYRGDDPVERRRVAQIRLQGL
jgi:hypothetical protein